MATFIILILNDKISTLRNFWCEGPDRQPRLGLAPDDPLRKMKSAFFFRILGDGFSLRARAPLPFHIHLGHTAAG